MFRKRVEQPSKQTEELDQGLAVRERQAMAEKESCIFGTLGTVNQLLQFMTSLDYVKGMIQDAGSQTEMIASATESSEEITAATEEISSYVQESTTKMQNAMTETEHSLNQVDNTFGEIEKNINGVEAVKTIMTEVTEEAGKINELVNVIKAVADQTNLLALNASIEAARAGEHGRGFAVVADEIKKLAENTKEQVDIIRSIVEGLSGKINEASGEIGRVVDTFKGSKTAINQATAGIGGITLTMSQIEDSFASISSNVEEQTATTQEMSAGLHVINEKAIKLKSEADRTGKAFFDISQKVDGIRMNALQCAPAIDAKTMIDLSITDHLMWKWRVYNMILGYIELEVKAVGDHHGCRLGKWAATLDHSNPRIKEVLSKMEQPHANIHQIAKKAIQEFNSGHRAGAETLLPEIERNSKVVVDSLIELKRYL